MKTYGWPNFTSNAYYGPEFTDIPMNSHVLLSKCQQKSTEHPYTGATLPMDMTDYNYASVENCFTINDMNTEAIFNSPKCLQDTEPPRTETVSCFKDYHVTSNEMLKNLQNKKVNLILLATSLGKNEIIKNLENNLDCKSSCIIPLSGWPGENTPTKDFEESECSDQVSTCSDNSNCPNEPPDDNTLDVNDKKRKWSDKKDETYWKRRKCNNEAARRSREAKKDRFVWMEKRTKELGNENSDLEKQLNDLKDRLSYLKELKKKTMCY